MRLTQYLAQCGIGSRRQCQRLITAGRVTVDGIPPAPNATIAANTQPTTESPQILVDGQPVPAPEPKAYWLYHKPVGVDCRLLPDDPDSLLQLLPTYPRLYPTGRLDKDSRGLILLTNDGELTQRLMHPDFSHTKTYEVRVEPAFDCDFIANMAAGVCYGDITTKPCQCQPLTNNQFEITLTQGLNRQIRRMCRALGFRVVDLKRVKLMAQSLLDNDGIELAEGQMRPLTDNELAALLIAVGMSPARVFS